MNNRTEQAIADCYMECRHTAEIADGAFNEYYHYCARQRRPFVRLDRRGARYRVEVELTSGSHHFPKSMWQKADDIFAAVLPADSKAERSVSGCTIACEDIPKDHAHRIASELYQLALDAPLRERPVIPLST